MQQRIFTTVLCRNEARQWTCCAAYHAADPWGMIPSSQTFINCYHAMVIHHLEEERFLQLYWEDRSLISWSSDDMALFCSLDTRPQRFPVGGVCLALNLVQCCFFGGAPSVLLCMGWLLNLLPNRQHSFRSCISSFPIFICFLFL